MAAFDFRASIGRVDLRNVQIGSYLLHRRVASGGFAAVWAGRHIEQKSWRAVKILPVAMDQSDGMRRAIDGVVDEYRPMLKMERLRSLPRFYDHCAIEGVVRPLETALGDDVYEFVPGEQVRGGDAAVELHGLVFEYANRGQVGPQYMREAHRGGVSHLDDLYHLALSLSRCHADGHVHCDLKPENILWSLNEDSTLMLADWGISKNLEKQKLLGRPFGSLAYLAPEYHEEGVALSSDRDVYALGCCLYELYSEEKPFAVDRSRLPTAAHVWEASFAAHTSVERPWLLDASKFPVSAELSEIIYRCMLVEPGHRPAAKDICDTIEGEAERLRPPRDRARMVAGAQLPVVPGTFATTGFAFPIVPEFREMAFGQVPYFISLNVGARDQDVISQVFESLYRHYGWSYTCLEVYGRSEFIVRVWDRRGCDRIDSVVRELDGIVGKAGGSVLVNVAVWSKYLRQAATGALNRKAWRTADGCGKYEAALLALQLERHRREVGAASNRSLSAYAKDAMKLLKTHGVLMSDSDPFARGRGPLRKVACVMFVHGGPKWASNEVRMGYASLIADKVAHHTGGRVGEARRASDEGMEKFLSSALADSMAVYAIDVNKPTTVGSSHDAALIVEFTAPDYTSVRDVPYLLLRTAEIKNWRTTTSLCTGRFSRLDESASILPVVGTNPLAD